MNTDTGQIYRTDEAIKAALARGEPIVEVSELVAKFVELGQQVSEKQGMTRGQARRRLREMGLLVPKKHFKDGVK